MELLVALPVLPTVQGIHPVLAVRRQKQRAWLAVVRALCMKTGGLCHVFDEPTSVHFDLEMVGEALEAAKRLRRRVPPWRQ